MVVVTTPTADAVDASVIVCTRNRSGAMTLLLESLQRLEVPPGVRWELIVVDNGSSDDTPATLASFETLLPMQIVREPMPGLARARNAGLAAARGQVLLCTDDDCVPDSKWLAAVYEEFRRAPTLGMLGGRVELYDARDRPTTTRTSRERRRITALFELDDIIGCNMSFRRSAFEAIGPFDVALGGGTGARAGEDVDFVYRALRAGIQMAYTPEALVYHNHGRRTDAQVRDLTRAYTVARGALFCKYLLAGDAVILRRIQQDLAFHRRAFAADVRRARFPTRVFRHYAQIGAGAAYWIRHGLLGQFRRAARAREETNTTRPR